MTTLFLVIQVVIAIIITISVLLQKSSSIGLGQYSGSNESLFGAKGPAGFLAKFTAVMGILFVVNTLALAYFYQQDAKTSILDSVDTSKMIEQNAVPDAASIPAVPQANTPVAPAAPQTSEAPATPSIGEKIDSAVAEVNATANEINSAIGSEIDKAVEKTNEVISEINATIAPIIAPDTNSTNK